MKRKADNDEALGPWEKALSKISVSKILERNLESKPLVVINKIQTIHTALDMLAEHEILSAPVVDKHKQGTFLGFVDTLDLAGYVLHHIEDGDMDSVLATRVEHVINYSKADPSVVVKETDSLLELFEMFKMMAKRGLHRVAVSSADGLTLKGVVSQSDFIKLAYNSKVLLKNTNKKLSEMRDVSVIRPTISVFIDSPFVDVLEVLYRNRIQGLALLDTEGRCCGNISLSDIRGLTHEGWKSFHLSTLAFLVKSGIPPTPPLTVGADTTLGEALETIVTNRVHRLFVTDDTQHLRGLVSLSDLIAVLE